MQAIVHSARQPLQALPLSPDCAISYLPDWLATAEADRLQALLYEQLNWQPGQVRLFGKWLDIPRLHCWYGDAGVSYRWSGQRSEPQPWPPQLLALRERLQTHSGQRFNGVLANLYRNGEDCMHWHADDEAELGPRPQVAAISLGAERRFSLRHKAREYPAHRLNMGHGSLLLMSGATQHHWQHCLPRSKRVQAPRISLTFRQLLR